MEGEDVLDSIPENLLEHVIGSDKLLVYVELTEDGNNTAEESDIVIFCKDKRITSIQHVPPDVRIATSTLFCKNTTLDTRTTFIVTLSLVGAFFNLNVCCYHLSTDWLGLIKSETSNLQMTNRLILHVSNGRDCNTILTS